MRRGHAGFTLVELTVVLVVISLLLTTGMQLLTAQMTSSRYAETRTKQEAIRVALISFISKTNRMPCPAAPGIPAGAALYGAEAVTPGTCSGVTSSGTGDTAVSVGIVPWTSLGLPEEMATDGHFNKMTYVVTTRATGLTSQTVAGMRGAITIHSGTPTLPGQAPAGNQLNDCSAGSTINNCAAVVAIISHGKNGLGAFIVGGGQIPTGAASADEIENADSDGQVVKRDFVESGYDDSIMALSANELLAGLTQAGAIKDVRAEVNTQFTIMRGAIEAMAIASRIAGPVNTVGQASFTIPNAAPLVRQDPWGNSISYSVSANPVITASRAAGEEAFRLTSSGPDTSTATDDIVLLVTVGELQGLFARTGF